MDSVHKHIFITLFPSSGFCALGKILSLVALPTIPCAQSVEELGISPLTASLLGNRPNLCFALYLNSLYVCFIAKRCPVLRTLPVRLSIPSCFSTYTQRQGDPPQSAQDKARMDKEYLSLMAELGEAPVPASGGAPNNPPPSGPRATGPSTNQPPPVSTQGSALFLQRCRMCVALSFIFRSRTAHPLF